MVIGLPPSYLPSRAWFCLYAESTQVCLLKNRSVEKDLSINKTFIPGPNGLQTLTIPLVKYKLGETSLDQLMISYNDPWLRNHKGSIEAAYGNAPLFEFLKDDLWEILDRKYTFLIDLNLALHAWHMKVFRMNFSKHEQEEDSIHPDNIRLIEWQTLQDKENELPVYKQIFEERFGFRRNVSALDILFIKGRLG